MPPASVETQAVPEIDAPITTADEAIAYLERLIDYERSPGFSYRRLDLTAIRRLLARLDNPERGLSVIHIAGSKGKGSTALFAESILLAAGESVGTFTSPHLERWTERFRIDGCEVSGTLLADAVGRLRPHVEVLRREDSDHAPTFFDATTAAALLVFRASGVDRAVIEVGLGGRLDSTNAVDAGVTCVTGIELEHTAQLGNSLGEIAGEKAGIFAPGVPAVIGALPDEARRVVETRARDLGAPLARLGHEFCVEVCEPSADGLGLVLRDGEIEVETTLSVLGAHQAANAAMALACVRRVRGSDAGLAEAAARGLAGAVLPGRNELIGGDRRSLIDSSHTAASAQALAAVLAQLPRHRCHLVLSVSTGKDLDAILAALLPAVDELTLTRADPRRSLAPAEIRAAVRIAAPNLPARVVPNPHLALRAAHEGLGGEDLLVVAGSVYLAGIARAILRRPDPSPPVAVTQSSPRVQLGES